jgi:hypothetical protein
VDRRTTQADETPLTDNSEFQVEDIQTCLLVINLELGTFLWWGANSSLFDELLPVIELSVFRFLPVTPVNRANPA